jgi:RNA-directed DNA polymerase
LKLYQFICDELETSKPMVDQFSETAPLKYKRFEIAKRTRGTRTIAQPSRELKAYQSILVDFLEGFLPVHDAAHAYKKGSSIKKNASRHLKSKYLLKMDFENFFNSIKPIHFVNLLNEIHADFSKNELNLMINLLFWRPNKSYLAKLMLSVGAPSSPLISNSILYFFDLKVSTFCMNNNITYTRYADDLTFSTNKKDILFEIPEIIKSILNESFSEKIYINERKTIFTSKAHNMHVTGITLTPDGKLSIGRSRKRYISSLVHNYTNNSLEPEKINHLKGLLAFAYDIEPNFKAKMINKYGFDTIERLKKEGTS